MFSEAPSISFAQRARLGSRFQYWRGQSGERYLFNAVPAETLGDFRCAVTILAEPTADGRFMAWAVADIDAGGRLVPHGDAWPAGSPDGAVAFVHFLAATQYERRSLIEDLFGPAEPEPLSLAA